MNEIKDAIRAVCERYNVSYGDEYGEGTFAYDIAHVTDRYEADAGVEKHGVVVEEEGDNVEALKAENARLKAALEEIASIAESEI